MTDAHVVLGTLADQTRLGGPRAARPRARPWPPCSARSPSRSGLDVEAAAAAVAAHRQRQHGQRAARHVDRARPRPARASRSSPSAARGRCTRCALADELGIPRVIVPRYPGVAAALGLLATDIRHDLRRSWLVPTARITRGARRRRARGAGGRGPAAARALVGGRGRLRAGLRARHALPRAGLQPHGARCAPRPVTAATLAAAERAFARRARAPLRLHAERHRDGDRDAARCARWPARRSSTGSPPTSRVAAATAARQVFDGAWREWTVRLRDALAAGDAIGPRRSSSRRTRRSSSRPAGAAASGAGGRSCCSGRARHERTCPTPSRRRSWRARFHHIAEEMAVVEYRSSYSPIIREMLDFNCGLFTADGRMVANSEQIPAQLGLMQFALQAVLAKWGDDVAPGRRVPRQPPVHGRHAHARPAGLRARSSPAGRIVAWAGSIAHHIDIGGRFPGTESAQCTELFQEGLIFPAIKLVRGRRRVRGALRADRGQRARPGLHARRPRRPARRLQARR